MVLCLALAGCSVSQPGPGPTSGVPALWRELIDQALADPTISDFQRQVLADYRVTDAEYQVARQKFAQCMADAGWLVTFPNPDGGFSVDAAPGSGKDPADPFADVDRCQATTLNYVEQVYLGMRDNPGGVPAAQQIRDCFKRNGVPDGAGMSDDAFERMIADPNYHASTPAGKLCYWDPTGSLGLTEDDAVELDANRRVFGPSESPT